MNRKIYTDKKREALQGKSNFKDDLIHYPYIIFKVMLNIICFSLKWFNFVYILTIFLIWLSKRDKLTIEKNYTLRVY